MKKHKINNYLDFHLYLRIYKNVEFVGSNRPLDYPCLLVAYNVEDTCVWRIGFIYKKDLEE